MFTRTLLVVGLLGTLVRAESNAVLPFVEVPERVELRFEPTELEATLPRRFRLTAHDFAASSEVISTAGIVRSYEVEFPSPMRSGSTRNDRVSGRYLQPHGPGPHPGCVLLHPRGGGFPFINQVADLLARRGVATFVIELPYHGDRYDPETRRRMISVDADRTLEAVTQAVSDVRRAFGWLTARPEVDAKRVGIAGISLGGFVAATAAAVEPRCARLGVFLAGGDVAGLVWDHWDPQARIFRRRWEARGGTKDSLARLIVDVEPTTHANRLAERPVLLIAASKDEIVPRSSTLALHSALGEKPDLVWLEAGHLTSALYLFAEIDRVATFLTGTDR